MVAKRPQQTIYEGRIPFDKKGNQLHYPGYSYDEDMWVDNCIWNDRLMFTGFSRGRSAAYGNWQSVVTGKKYTMFLTDLEDVLRRQINAPTMPPQGGVTANWTFCKRGGNYGIKLAPVPPKGEGNAQ